MNFWLIMMMLWFAIDVFRYIKYRISYRKLHDACTFRDTNHKNIKTLLNDLKEKPELLNELLNDVFYSKVKLEDLNFDDVCNVLFELVGEHPDYKSTITSIIKKFQKREQKINERVIFKRGNTYHKRLQIKNHKIESWFPILPMYFVKMFFNLLVKMYMVLILGFKYYTFKNELVIWYTKYSDKKGVPLIFFHPSVGGVSLQFTILKYFHDTHNIIMPEIPAISFVENSGDKPLPISQIIDDVNTFIKLHYVGNSDVDYGKLKINLMGHSLGASLCSAYINKYPQMIDNFFCVEGQIFFNRALRIYADFDADVRTIPSNELISVPLFNRDLYVQYFMYKRLTLDYVCIFDFNEDNEHIKIHMYHIKNDKRILIKPQLDYAKYKNIPVKYHLFNGTYVHGAFVLNNNIKQYIMNDIKKIYTEQKHFDHNILKQKD
jgi:pimeloyl-ACP methyl ester carboxylesterase